MDPPDRFLRQLSPQRTQALLRVTSSTREGLEQALDGQKKRQRPGDGQFFALHGREKDTGPLNKFLALATSIWVDFWIFSDQAQLLDPESAASKEPRSGLVA